MKESRSAFKILTGKPTGKRPLGRPRPRWEDNIRMELKDTIDLSQGKDCWRAFVNAAFYLQVPLAKELNYYYYRYYYY